MDIIRVNRENKADIKTKINETGGRILTYYVYCGEYSSGGGFLRLFSKSLIKTIEGRDLICRGKRFNRRSREYQLRPYTNRELRGLLEDPLNLEEPLKVEQNYLFIIRQQSYFERPLLTERGRTFFIPKRIHLNKTFKFALKDIMMGINTVQRSQKHKPNGSSKSFDINYVFLTEADKIVDYVLDNLKKTYGK